MQKPIVDSDRCSDCPARKICNALIPKEQQKPDTGWDAEGCGALIGEQSTKTDTPQPPLPCRSGGVVETLDEVIRLSMMLETNETERWEASGRPKNDGYINGSHSGYGHALQDMRRRIDRIKLADSRHPLGVVGDRGAEGTRGGGSENSGKVD